MAKSVHTPVRTRTARARGLMATLAVSLIAALLIPFTAAPAGAAPVTDPNIAAGKAGTLFTLTFSAMEGLLLDTSNFGPAGTEVVSSLTIKPETERVTAEYLSDVDIFFDGWVYREQWQTDEINTIDEWVDRGGVIILTEDTTDALANDLGILFGAPTVSEIGDAQDEVPVPALTPVAGQAAHPMVAGPFGTITTMTPFGTLGNLGCSTVDNGTCNAPGLVGNADWTPIYEDDDGNAVVAVRDWGLGHVILTTDEGIFRDTNAAAAMNIFSYALTFTEDTLVPLSVTGPTGALVLDSGDPLALTFGTTGGDASAITWRAADLPTGAILDTATGGITGTPADGTWPVVVTASPLTGLEGSASFTICVGDLTVTNPGAQTDREREVVGPEIEMEAAGGDCTAITWDDGDTLPDGLSIDPSTGAISGSPTADGTFMVEITASQGATDVTVMFDWTITDNPEPVAVADSVTVDFGDPINLDLCANDTLADEPTTAAITGAPPTGVMQTDCVLSGTPTADGTTNLTYVLTDDDGDMSAPAAITITVNPEPNPDPDPDPDPGPDPDPDPDPEPPVFCKGREATIVGTEDADVLLGTEGDDVIVGLGGNDQIRGFGGNDLVCAGPGDDLVVGGGGADELWGNSGNDTIRGNSGSDTIRGGSGADDISGGSAGDDIRGNSGRDNIRGGTGADDIHGGSAGDDIRGNKGRDTINGGTGADDIHGGSAGDDISGGRGNDTINGGTGADSLDGGSGTDTCNGGPGTDTSTRCETRVSAVLRFR